MSTSTCRSTARAFDAAGFEPGDLTSSLADLARPALHRPRTTFATTYPYGLFAVPLDEVVEIHSSSGTTGKPVVGGYTQRRPRDLGRAGRPPRRRPPASCRGDVAQVAFGYGMFTGGFGLHYGLQRVGAAVRASLSAGNTARQIQFMEDFGTTVLICTPSYALYLGEALEKAGVRGDA